MRDQHSGWLRALATPPAGAQPPSPGPESQNYTPGENVHVHGDRLPLNNCHQNTSNEKCPVVITNHVDPEVPDES